MNAFFRDLHNQLLKGIDDCEQINTDLRKHIECCFHISEKINHIVEEQIVVMKFDTEAEEIHFFKRIRPEFSSLVEFYSIIYRAELFAPEIGIDRKDFWNSELFRAEQFIRDNNSFYEYNINQETHNDKAFFLQKAPESKQYQQLLTQIRAREIYIEFINKKINNGD